MIRDGDCDFVLAGGVDAPILPELIHGFANMNATIKVQPGDRAYTDPGQASRPFSGDRKGFVLSEGAGVVVLAAESVERLRTWANVSASIWQASIVRKLSPAGHGGTGSVILRVTDRRSA